MHPDTFVYEQHLERQARLRRHARRRRRGARTPARLLRRATGTLARRSLSLASFRLARE